MSEFQTQGLLNSFCLPDGSEVTIDDVKSLLADCDNALQIAGWACSSCSDAPKEVRQRGYNKSVRLRQLLANVRAAVDNGDIIIKV